MEQVEASRTSIQAAAKALRTNPGSDRALVEWYRTLIDQRMIAEGILANDENLFRMAWNPHSRLLTFQLLGSDELTLPQEATSKRNKLLYYSASYASWYPTEGLPRAAVARLLPHNLTLSEQRKKRHAFTSFESGENGTEMDLSASLEQVSYTSQHGLEGRIDLRTCRLLFQQGQGDVMVRHRPKTELEVRRATLPARRKRKEAYLTTLLAQRIEASQLNPSDGDAQQEAREDAAMDVDGASTDKST